MKSREQNAKLLIEEKANKNNHFVRSEKRECHRREPLLCDKKQNENAKPMAVTTWLAAQQKGSWYIANVCARVII